MKTCGRSCCRPTINPYLDASLKWRRTHSSIADHGSLSFLQFQHVSAEGSVGEQEVNFGTLVCTFEQRQVHALHKKQPSNMLNVSTIRREPNRLTDVLNSSPRQQTVRSQRRSSELQQSLPWPSWWWSSWRYWRTASAWPPRSFWTLGSSQQTDQLTGCWSSPGGRCCWFSVGKQANLNIFHKLLF